MKRLGYALSSEEHAPNDLVRNARLAEEAGFTFALISDHFHPWLDSQGHSPFVWSVIGGIAQATERLELGTGVTCPTVRIHPAIIAQAAATSAAMMPGRFFLGVGSGEALNEHILGDPWPPAKTRLEMLEEAIELIREMWKGEDTTFYGEFFTVENARIYTLPDKLPGIYIAAGGKKSAEVAGRIGDGLISTSPDPETLSAFDEAGEGDRSKIGQVTVCWAETEEQAVQTSKEIWANAAIPGELGQELPMPAHYEQAAKLVRDEDITKAVICGPDPEKHVEAIQKYYDTGYEDVYIHQVGADQEGFIRFYEREIMPALKLGAKETAGAR
jgi:G6PDH family F420-dependent oxidoreductase